jgi:hypothetical protein
MGMTVSCQRHNDRCSRQAIFGWRPLTQARLFDSLAAELGRYAATAFSIELASVAASLLLCDACGETGVERVRTDPPGVAVWRCRRCGDLKRWCPRCEQGWLRRFRSDAAHLEFISCEECDATWPRGAELRPPGVDRQSYLRALGTTEAWADPQVVREREPAPPAA